MFVAANSVFERDEGATVAQWIFVQCSAAEKCKKMLHISYFIIKATLSFFPHWIFIWSICVSSIDQFEQYRYSVMHSCSPNMYVYSSYDCWILRTKCDVNCVVLVCLFVVSRLTRAGRVLEQYPSAYADLAHCLPTNTNKKSKWCTL